jgi:hypothetical protein
VDEEWLVDATGRFQHLARRTYTKAAVVAWCNWKLGLVDDARLLSPDQIVCATCKHISRPIRRKFP